MRQDTTASHPAEESVGLAEGEVIAVSDICIGLPVMG